MGPNPHDRPGQVSTPDGIQTVTRQTRHAAVELLVRFFREEGFATPPSRIEENLERMLSDPSCWCALAVKDGRAQAIITVSTVLYVEWGRLGEIGDLYVLPEHRRCGLARRLIERAKEWCHAQGCTAVSVTITPLGEQRHRLGRFYMHEHVYAAIICSETISTRSTRFVCARLCHHRIGLSQFFARQLDKLSAWSWTSPRSYVAGVSFVD
jgi:GNAT superfamily N-acetyltransferase